jgi:hypothetical protein
MRVLGSGFGVVVCGRRYSVFEDMVQDLAGCEAELEQALELHGGPSLLTTHPIEGQEERESRGEHGDPMSLLCGEGAATPIRRAHTYQDLDLWMHQPVEKGNFGRGRLPAISILKINVRSG